MILVRQPLVANFYLDYILTFLFFVLRIYSAGPGVHALRIVNEKNTMKDPKFNYSHCVAIQDLTSFYKIIVLCVRSSSSTDWCMTLYLNIHQNL